MGKWINELHEDPDDTERTTGIAPVRRRRDRRANESRRMRVTRNAIELRNERNDAMEHMGIDPKVPRMTTEGATAILRGGNPLA